MNTIDYDSILKPAERAELRLRALYQSRGFRRFKMSKFEEYDFYSDKKDFLTDASILSFTDTDGRLMALKPDVTLSIVKNTRFAAGTVDRIFYSENVYRAPASAGGYREIRQTGAECIGDLTEDDILGTVLLAAESLALISPDYSLNISHLGIVSSLLDRTGLSQEQRKSALTLIAMKNMHELRSLLGDNAAADRIVHVLSLSGSPGELIPELQAADLDAEALTELSRLSAAVSGTAPKPRIRLDFSVVSDLSYYNGIVMQGYIPGVPEAVLSGGEYDPLLRQMGRSSRGVGFCVYTDLLERFFPEDGSAGGTVSVAVSGAGALNIALPKGRLGETVLRAFEAAGYSVSADSEHERRLVLEDSSRGIRVFWVKPSDVHIYVERGVADIGVVGRDILLEHEPDVYELMDLGLGRCYIAEAALRGYTDDTERTKRVATKFEHIARDYYAALGRDIDIIRLNGSIELAPILGLSDVIVDIVETGTTLRENDLEVTDRIVDISARLIAGKSSYEFKRAEIMQIIEALRAKR